jgi:hypothetical protein
MTACEVFFNIAGAVYAIPLPGQARSQNPRREVAGAALGFSFFRFLISFF